MSRLSISMRRAATMFLLASTLLLALVTQTSAHPLGNFTINHFARIEIGSEKINVRYVIDMAEIATFQELQTLHVDEKGKPIDSDLDAYLARVAGQYASAILLTVDGMRVPLEVTAKRISMPPGAGGLPTLRVECDLTGKFSIANDLGSNATHSLKFEDTNHRGRIGWREIVIKPASSISVFNSTAFGSALTNELKAYPEDKLSAPIDESVAELSWSEGNVPPGAAALLKRDGHAAVQSRDMFAELISSSNLTLGVVLLSLLIAVGLGALHAFSPGHGKTVVGAYLVGSRGTPRHAAFLGLVVTITHTLGVFGLGVVTLFASRYVVPERLFPVLNLISGAIVVIIGGGLLVRRLRAAIAGQKSHGHSHEGHEHVHDTHAHEHGDQLHAHPRSEGSALVHSHGGREHSHLPPGADGTSITWRSLLALGVSGGLLPCPSALVVLLAAISLQRVGFGILLVVAFSIGLASTLTGIGLVFLYAGRLMKRRLRLSSSPLVRILPVLSSFVIMCVGILICYEGLFQAGLNPSAFVTHLFAQSGALTTSPLKTVSSMGAMALLGLGLVFGLKHATEVDHVVAVSTIVSEHRNLLRATLVGALWGTGHTASLVFVGLLVLALRISIPESVAGWLEFGVALMIIWLGASALARALRQRSKIHLHKHEHDGEPHIHVHFHDSATEHSLPSQHSHTVTRIGFKPLLIGMMHGLAGSAALTLLVLTQIDSAVLGLLYLAIFGLGSIVGMILMSGLIGLPFALSARKFSGINHRLQITAAALSIAFGIWYAYQTGMASGF